MLNDGYTIAYSSATIITKFCRDLSDVESSKCIKVPQILAAGQWDRET